MYLYIKLSSSNKRNLVIYLTANPVFRSLDASRSGVFNLYIMNELIKVSENNGKNVVSAKELYLFLGFDKSQWSRWSKSNILENQFACENEDYVGVRQIVEGNITSDYAITVDFAKRLSMMAKTEKGEQARQYFIECEKKVNKPLSQLEIILKSAQMLVEFEQKQKYLCIN